MRGFAPLLRALAVFVLVFGLVPFPAQTQSLKIKGMLVFGDSLVDTGNIFIGSAAAGLDPAVPPSDSPNRTYDAGRFSNGPVSVEYLWQLLTGFAPGTPRGVQPFLAAPPPGSYSAVNFAFGGTGTPFDDVTPGRSGAPGLLGQVDMARRALNGRKLPKDTLCVVATGSNDYRDDPPYHPALEPPEVIQNIVLALVSLYDDLGCRNTIVFDLPDPSLLPELDPQNDNDFLEHQLYLFHNGLLGAGVADLKAARPDYNLIRFDISTLLPALVSQGFNVTTPALDVLFPDPSLYPLGVPPSACLFVFPGACPDVNLDLTAQIGLFAFYDIVHPTTDLHRVIGQALHAAVTQ